MITPRRGEVWWYEQTDIARRPVVVLSPDVATQRSRRVLVAPCTSSIRRVPSEVRLYSEDDPVPSDCVVNLDSLEQVPVAELVECIGALSRDRLTEITQALAVTADG